MSDVRKYTNLLLEGVEEGLYDKDNIILACVKYMSEDEVKDMMETNALLSEEVCEGCGGPLPEGVGEQYGTANWCSAECAEEE